MSATLTLSKSQTACVGCLLLLGLVSIPISSRLSLRSASITGACHHVKLWVGDADSEAPFSGSNRSDEAREAVIPAAALLWPRGTWVTH